MYSFRRLIDEFKVRDRQQVEQFLGVGLQAARTTLRALPCVRWIRKCGYTVVQRLLSILPCRSIWSKQTYPELVRAVPTTPLTKLMMAVAAETLEPTSVLKDSAIEPHILGSAQGDRYGNG